MRWTWVGLLIILMCQLALAQAEGVVESFGFSGFYRPECWVPITVRLHPTGQSAEELQIRVIQEDLDQDRVVAVRDIALTPDLTGRNGNGELFWMYFRPQPTKSVGPVAGLQDAAVGGSPTVLEQQLKVILTTKGGKTIANLPITQQGIKRVDVETGGSARLRGVRFVLCVTDGVSLPSVMDYQLLDGITDMPVFAIVRPNELPEDIRGYEMVDGVLWLGAAAPDPAKATEEPRYRALETYVKQGGMLVVCQGVETGKTKGLDAMLPVRFVENRETQDLTPLLDMTQMRANDLPESFKAPRRVAYATAKQGAVVLREIGWPDGGASPFVARKPFGAGCVTWVGQDLGEPSVARALRGRWVKVWDELFGWRNDPTEPEKEIGKRTAIGPYTRVGRAVDLAPAFTVGGKLTVRASGYILLALFFFGVYWVVAGPGMYAWLATRKLASLNWFAFGLAAVIAAVVAWLVVKVTQLGRPELDHVSIVRAVAGEPATVQSRVELHISSDGMKELALKKGADKVVNWITPYPEHPSREDGGGKFLAMKQYEMKLLPADTDEEVKVSMPWRSTSKQLQLRWTGDASGSIDGKAMLSEVSPELEGRLANNTPWDLKEVYLVWRRLAATGDGSNGGGDRVLYLPGWPQGKTIDLAATLMSTALIGSIGNEAVPRQGKVVFGSIERVHKGFDEKRARGEGWAGWWYSRFTFDPNQLGGPKPLADGDSGYQLTMPLCSIFDRVPPVRNVYDDNRGWQESRGDILRVGMRSMNVSPAVAAGNLVVLAEAAGDLPVPLLVEGSEVKGKGMIFYQGILPLARPVAKPASAPATAPADVEKTR